MLDRKSSAEIDDAVARWIARGDRESLSETERAEFDAWLADDPRRLGAYVRANAILHMIGEDQAALGDALIAPAKPSRPRFSRRALLGAGMGTMAAGVAATLLIVPMGTSHYSTLVGEVLRVPLDDGSTVTLNSDSALEVRRADGRFALRLARGEALFDIARGAGDLSIAAGDVRIAANGAICAMRCEDRAVDLMVVEGSVEMREASRSGGRMLTRGETVRALAGTAEPVHARLDAEELNRALLWRDGKIAFSSETLGDAATRFGRYSRTRIRITDPKVAQLQVTGLFNATDPRGFASAVATMFDLKVEDRGNVLALSRN